jgi:hypothetical protein
MGKLPPLLISVALLAGCSSSGGLFGGGTGNAAPVAAPGLGPRPLDADSVTLYLQTLRDLVGGDPVLQADTFRAAQAAADSTPTTTNRLNLALALATPGHPSSDAAEAQRRLGELLASGAALLPEERILAAVHLKEVEQRLILDAEARRLQGAIEAATAQRNDETTQRLEAALAENRQLRQELNEAREKLDAITNIERSIRERENGANPQ